MKQNLSQLFLENINEPLNYNVNYKLNVSDECKSIINKFIEYTKNTLDITELPNIVITDDRTTVPMTTGAFLPDSNTIYIYAKNRALCDYLRTLAHELSHYKQRLDGKIPKTLNGRNKPLEDEANIDSGDLIYNFAHSNEDNKVIYDL